MDNSYIPATITAIGGLLAIVLAKPLWSLFKQLIDHAIMGDKEEVQRLHEEIKRLTDLINSLRERIDQIEDESHKKDIEIERLRHRLDDYVASSQYLTMENERLRAELRQRNQEREG